MGHCNIRCRKDQLLAMHREHKKGSSCVPMMFCRMEKNWAFLEHGSKLIIIYSMLPCTVLFLFNPKAPKGAIFHSGFCYQNLTEVWDEPERLH